MFVIKVMNIMFITFIMFIMFTINITIIRVQISPVFQQPINILKAGAPAFLGDAS